MRSRYRTNDPRSTIFFFTEVDDPIFCPITHLVALALADDAFEAPSLTTPRRVFEHKVWGPVLCTPLRWEQEKLKTPIFRRDEERALPYSQFKHCLNRLGLAAGFKERLTSYCFRRGTANVVDRKFVRGSSTRRQRSLTQTFVVSRYCHRRRSASMSVCGSTSSPRSSNALLPTAFFAC
jgi:hypothetical protein